MSKRFRHKLANLRQKRVAEQEARDAAQEQEIHRRREEGTRQKEDLKDRQKRVQQELAPLLELVNKEYLDGKGQITFADEHASVSLSWDHTVRWPPKSLHLRLTTDNRVTVSAGDSYSQTYSLKNPNWGDRVEDAIYGLLTEERSE